MPYRINLYGGPGVGKSTLAAWLYASLKRDNFQVELVNEWIKSWAWQNIKPQGYDQVYVFAKQLRREEIILRQGISIITDSPLALQLAYSLKNFPHLFGPLNSLLDLFELTYPAIDILLDRVLDLEYQQEGRYHNQKEAIEIDRVIKEQLVNRKVLQMNGPEINKYIVLDLIKGKL